MLGAEPKCSIIVNMIRSHHIATVLVAEHQRELRASARRGWRIPHLFSRRSAELEPVPPGSVASPGGDGPGPALDYPVGLAAALPVAEPAPPRRRITSRRRPGSPTRSGRKSVGV